MPRRTPPSRIRNHLLPRRRDSRGWYDPRWHCEHEEETQRALDLIFSGHFNRRVPDLYDPIRDVLLARGDYSMGLADLVRDADWKTFITWARDRHRVARFGVSR
jgi:hypothetical protein